MFRWSIALLVGLLALTFTGCGDSGSTISGAVTYDGQPIKKGNITFTPANGKGQTVGGDIIDGRYNVKNVSLSKVIVFVTASQDGPGPVSSEEMANAAKDPARKGKVPADGLIPLAIVPPDAIGNNAELEVKGPTMTHDLKLTKPAKK